MLPLRDGSRQYLDDIWEISSIKKCVAIFEWSKGLKINETKKFVRLMN